MTFLNSKIENAILDYFFDHPTRKIHARELARQTGISHFWVRKTLQRLESMRLVASQRIGNLVLFQADRNDERFLMWKKLQNLQKIFESGIIAEIKRASNPQAIILLGSYNDGTDTEESDIDIAIVRPARRAQTDTARFEKALARRVSTKIIDPKRAAPEFMISIINGTKIDGYLHDQDLPRISRGRKSA